jgi:hypothetical protein
MSDRDPLHAELPEDEGLEEPELPEEDIEPARLLANEARARLRGDGLDDDEIEAWTRVYYEQDRDGDVEGLVRFIAAQEAAGRRPDR